MIRDNQITTKGSCVEQNRDYFLLDNRYADQTNCRLYYKIDHHFDYLLYRAPNNYFLLNNCIEKYDEKITTVHGLNNFIEYIKYSFIISKEMLLSSCF